MVAPSGAFACRNCQRTTRSTGDNGGVQLCPECYELAGLENQYSDSGNVLEPAYVEVAREQLTSLASHIGMRAYELHPELAALVQATTETISITKRQPQIVENAAAVLLGEEGTSRAYIVLSDSEMAVVCARSNGDAKRQARKLFGATEGCSGLV